jgi:D-beta-D-heptose 7-phosphate kinase/D-beta-D-heptose 1-phosphate adenosyltransferase
VIGEQQRALVLAALASVDAVVMFDEGTPLALINAIRPDVIVKGGDYTENRVVGADEVKSWGGKVAIVPLVGGLSTSEVLRRVAQSAD